MAHAANAAAELRKTWIAFVQGSASIPQIEALISQIDRLASLLSRWNHSFSAATNGFERTCRAAWRSAALFPRISTSISYSAAIRCNASRAIGAGAANNRRPRTLSTWPLVVRNDSMLVRCQRSLVAEAHTLFSPDTPHSQVVNAALTCLLRQPRARAAEFAFLWEVDHAPITDDLLPHDRRIERAARAAAARRETHAR